MTSIENILFEHGPIMSSELSNRLHLKESIPLNTASQKVSRDRNIKKIKGFYTSNQSFCFLEQHEQNGLFYDRFIKSLFDNGKKYWYCINALRLHGGMLHKDFLECYTNYPVLALKGHLPFNKVLQKFIEQGILVYNSPYYSIAPKFSLQRNSSVANRTIEMIKNDTITSFHSLVKNIGLISFNTGKHFAEYGKYRWSFKGVSAVTGLFQNGSPGFLLADILLGTSIYKDDVSFFIEKLKSIQSFANAPRIMPFLIVDDLDKEALGLLKQKGVVIGFIKELFGQKYAETLKELVSILTNAGASLKKSPDKYLDLIKQLKKYNEGLVNNIRGTLFEYMVGHIHSINCQSIDLGREIIENNARHEMDVLAIYNDRIVIAECKAIKSKIDIDVIDKWINIKIPAFKIWFDKQETFKKKQLEFEFWSTSGFTKTALDRLEKFSNSVQKYKVVYKQAEDMRQIARDMDNKKLKEELDNFFLKTDV
ncbi:hypothetical protein [uncultured Draconibacterium sp.]|uniref:hypothetical protein n=1 Tax=uncultured Draconibacterium sp. TaxID=1573823 RepID=UPI00321755ED